MSKIECVYLISSVRDIEVIDESSNILALDYPLVQLLSSNKIKCFLDAVSYNPVLRKLVGEFVSNWYRDKDGLNVIDKSEISLGSILQYRLAIRFANSIRFYNAIKENTKKYNKIHISRDIPDALQRVTPYFSESIEYFESNGKYDVVVTSSPERALIISPIIHKLSNIARILQWPFRNFLRKKVLIFPDWTYRNIVNDDCLSFNSFNIFRGFYLSGKKRPKSQIGSIFSKALDYELIQNNLKRIISDFKIDNKDSEDWVELFINILKDEYLKSQDKIVDIYNVYSELIEYYKPSMVVVPSYAHPWYNCVCGIAKEKNIPSLFVLDGYHFHVDKYLFQKNMVNESYLITLFGAMGGYTSDLYKLIFNIKDKDIIKISPPVLSFYQEEKSYENNTAIILFPYGVIHNPDCRWDKRFKYVIDVASCLKELGYTDISVKIKSDTSKDRKISDIDMLRLLLDKNGLSEIDIIHGELHEHMSSAKLFVGQLGTAVIESLYMEVPFYVYEPYSAGITDGVLADTGVSIDMVTRTILSLKKLIDTKQSLQLDNEKLFSGEEIQKIDYLSLINRANNEL